MSMWGQASCCWSSEHDSQFAIWVHWHFLILIQFYNIFQSKLDKKISKWFPGVRIYRSRKVARPWLKKLAWRLKKRYPAVIPAWESGNANKTTSRSLTYEVRKKSCRVKPVWYISGLKSHLFKRPMSRIVFPLSAFSPKWLNRFNSGGLTEHVYSYSNEWNIPSSLSWLCWSKVDIY